MELLGETAPFFVICQMLDSLRKSFCCLICPVLCQGLHRTPQDGMEPDELFIQIYLIFQVVFCTEWGLCLFFS